MQGKVHATHVGFIDRLQPVAGDGLADAVAQRSNRGRIPDTTQEQRFEVAGCPQGLRATNVLDGDEGRTTRDNRAFRNGVDLERRIATERFDHVIETSAVERQAAALDDRFSFIDIPTRDGIFEIFDHRRLKTEEDDILKAFAVASLNVGRDLGSTGRVLVEVRGFVAVGAEKQILLHDGLLLRIDDVHFFKYLPMVFKENLWDKRINGIPRRFSGIASSLDLEKRTSCRELKEKCMGDRTPS